jgi:hypothetical protein
MGIAAGSAALAVATCLALAQQPAAENAGSKETVLYNFTGGFDGSDRKSSLIFDSSGALYGTTVRGGTLNNGTAFKLTPPAGGGGQWTKTLLHSFSGQPDGIYPYAGLVFDSSGALYGTTVFGGTLDNYGTVYQLTPPSSGGTLWTETVLYRFTGGADGANPTYTGKLVFDRSGALYGTTQNGGNYGYGTVYKLTPPPGGTMWSLTTLYSFMGGSDGRNPISGVIFDRDGALYGAAHRGTSGYSTVYKLTPPPTGGTPWTATVVYAVGAIPAEGALVFDDEGALYGTTQPVGPGNWGTVYKLLPPASGGTQWTKLVLHTFTGGDFTGGADGSEPFGALILDQRGALYGTTRGGGLGYGTVYKVTPISGGTLWKETVLHSFGSSQFDGVNPWAGLVSDRSGTLYGTTAGGGNPGYGTVFAVK